MIRVLIAHPSALVRGALAFVLGAEHDIEVAAEVAGLDELAGLAHGAGADVAVLDLELVPLAAPTRLREQCRSLVECRVLVLAEARRAHVLQKMMSWQSPSLGFIAKDGPPGRLVAAVRELAGGEPVLDPDLVVSALRARSPLTPRETEVLGCVAEGLPVREIAQRLTLSPGTVRNHLSRIIGKTGARNRIEAVRIAQHGGWV